MNQTKDIKWIGLAKVTVMNESDILGGADSAYANAVGFAKTKAGFRKEVKSKLHFTI